ncbi:MAG TPA: hypothetical protein VFD58_37105 [Blastocatellia bacterium]|nr:hypothetical protein [Blastocatellia bacterium]
MKKPAIFSLAFTLLIAFTVFRTAHTQTEGQGAPEIIKHRANPHGADAITKGSTGVVTPPISYHGGQLIMMPTIYYIWYGDWNQNNGSDNPGGQQILRDFANSIGGSPYFAINTTYSVGGLNISGQVSFGGETAVGYTRGTRLRDADILNIVNNAINSNSLPYDPNGVYFVLTSSDVTEQSGFCIKYCGWHTAGTPSAGHVRYSFIGNANRCLNACAAQTTGPNGNAGVDAMASIIAHELEEATTDPDPRSGWVDSGGAENADKCAWTFGQDLRIAPNGATYNVTLGTRNYLIQRNLKHSSSGDTCNMSLTTQ